MEVSEDSPRAPARDLMELRSVLGICQDYARRGTAKTNGSILAKYGLKLLRVKLFNGQGHKELDFGPDKEPHYLDRVAEDILALKERRNADEEVVSGAAGTGAEAEPPAAAIGAEETDGSEEATGDDVPGAEPLETEIATDESTGEQVSLSADDVLDSPDATTLPGNIVPKPPAVLRLENYKRLTSALLMQVQYGVVGDHTTAVDPEGLLPDADLKGLATTRPYRALLIAPAKGTTAFLAVEVISRSHAGADLPKRLHKAAVGHNMKLRSQGPVADDGAIRALVRKGRVKEVELFKTISTSDAAAPKTRKVKLTIPLAVGASEGASILEHVKNWLPNRDTTDTPEPLDAKKEAEELASILWSSAAQLAFDDARVHVVSDTSDKRLQPLDKTEGFVYELGDEELDDEKFVIAVASIAGGLFTLNEMEMEPDWSDWLDEPSGDQ
jgi:hypothetical protein